MLGHHLVDAPACDFRRNENETITITGHDQLPDCGLQEIADGNTLSDMRVARASS